MKFQAKNSEQEVQDWMNQLEDDCIQLHMEAKEVIELTEQQRGDFLEWLLEESTEPQYKLMRKIAFYPIVNPERQKEILMEIQKLCEECRTYASRIKQQSHKDRLIRATAEWLFKKDMSVIQIVDRCIEIGLVEDIDRDNAERNIHRYIKNFPSFTK